MGAVVQIATADDAVTSTCNLIDFPRTDVGNGKMFAARYAGRVIHDHAAGAWFIWQSPIWTLDRDGAIKRLAKELVTERLSAALTLGDSDERLREVKWSVYSDSRKGLDAMLHMAASELSIATTGDDWDRHPMLFPFSDGVIDLKTGLPRNGSPADRLTKRSPAVFDRRATCPKFERFMLDVFAGYPELVEYLRRVIGYSLTGLTTEQALWIWFGAGANGKSTLAELIVRSLFGSDFAWTMPFPSSNWSDAMSDYQKAALQGRRFVQASEVAHRGKLNEELVKALTGGDTITARHPYGRPFTFTPTAKFFLRVNDKPQIRDDSHGMWRRIKLIPFEQTFPVNPMFADTLTAESAGILQWAIQGCLDWQRDGLREPAIVQAATAEYRAENDLLADFLTERCTVLDGLSVRASVLFDTYTAWANTHVRAEDRMSRKAFGLKLKKQFHAHDDGRHVTYHGLGIRDTE